MKEGKKFLLVKGGETETSQYMVNKENLIGVFRKRGKIEWK